MKLKQWLYGAAALAMLAACSDKDIASGSSGNGSGPEEEISGYLAIQINLPQEAMSTKADWEDTDADQKHQGLNDYYKDGEKYEYAVENALIILFKGSEALGEKKAVYYKHRTLKKPFFSNSPADDGTTTSYIAAIPVDAAPTDAVYAMVVLNRDDQYNFKVDANDKLFVGTTPIVATTTKEDGTVVTGTRFEDILKMTVDKPFIFKNNDGEMRFFMTNSPLSGEQGGTLGTPSIAGNISYLTKLTTDNIFPTETEAKEKVAGCIYVERAVAKVTYFGGALDKNAIKLKKDIVVPEGADQTEYKYTGFSLAGDVDAYKDVEITATAKYALTNTNNISYIVRNVDFKDVNTGAEGATTTSALGHFQWNLISNVQGHQGGYRMVGERPMPKLNDPFHTEIQNYYRTYWCHDPNYEVEMKENERTRIDQTDASKFNDLSSPLYCKENTFTVANQNHGNSTLAIFEVDYNISYKDKEGKAQVAKDIYTRNNDNSTLYISTVEAMAEEITRIAKDPEIRNAMKIAARANGKTPADGDEPGYSVTDHLDITIVDQDVIESSTVDGVTVNTVVGKELVVTKIALKLLKDDPWFSEKSKEVFANIIGTNDGNYTGANANGFLAYNEDGTVKKTTNAEGVTVDVYEKPQIQYELLTRVNLLNNVNVYTGGKSYYVIPIKHFGDYYTPWPETEGVTTTAVYNPASNDHAGNYLGRYGMVRNNWYELNITDLRALGSNIIPPIDDTLSDDNKEVKKYFAIEIHTLSWAKRTQNVQF